MNIVCDYGRRQCGNSAWGGGGGGGGGIVHVGGVRALFFFA